MEPRIGVIGLGRVGLCTAVCFASRGFYVVGVDIDPNRIEAIQRGTPPFYEPKLAYYLRTVVSRRRLRVTSDTAEAVASSDFGLVTVGTPLGEQGAPDLTAVRDASRAIGTSFRRRDSSYTVVVRSTVPPGTTKDLVIPELEAASALKEGTDFDVVVNPEFLREGRAIDDTRAPDRIILGAMRRRAADKVLRMWRRFLRRVPPVIVTNTVTAELIKHANNAFLAMRVSFINTIGNICARLPGSDVAEVAAAIGLDRRVGRDYLRAGPGYGGSCLPKDLEALVHLSRVLAYEPELLTATQRVNESQADEVIRLAESACSPLAGKRVGVLGLAFKAGTDDVRDAPALRVVKRLLEHGARVSVFDPRALENARVVLGSSIRYASSIEECLRGADLGIVMTDSTEFNYITPARLRKTGVRALLDARRALNPHTFEGRVRFVALGRGDATAQKRSAEAN